MGAKKKKYATFSWIRGVLYQANSDPGIFGLHFFTCPLFPPFLHFSLYEQRRWLQQPMIRQGRYSCDNLLSNWRKLTSAQGLQWGSKIYCSLYILPKLNFTYIASLLNSFSELYQSLAEDILGNKDVKVCRQNLLGAWPSGAQLKG